MVLLYVDDDAEDADVFCDALRSIDPTVQCVIASGGKEAIELLRAGLRPDFLFLDTNMPTMRGIEVLQAICRLQKFKSVPVVIYSTHITAEDRKAYSAQGACEFLVKPTSFGTLCDALGKIVFKNQNIATPGGIAG